MGLGLGLGFVSLLLLLLISTHSQIIIQPALSSFDADFYLQNATITTMSSSSNSTNRSSRLLLEHGRRGRGRGRRRSSRTSSGSMRSDCNIFQGKWVYDATYPLYTSNTCPFIDPEFNCQKYGRPDTLYQRYRWQPFDCDLPRFNGLYLLRKWRGKKIMFVGDSLSFNQWESLACLLYSWVPNSRTSIYRAEGVSSIVFEEFEVSLMLYRTPLLVDLERRNGLGTVLNLDSIRGGNVWKGMDVLIFNTWHWWTHTGRTQPWNYIQDGGRIYKDMNRMIAFYKGLTTWARWVDREVDPSKTRVFFVGISPTHYMGSDWNQPSRSCSSETAPFSGSEYPAGKPMEWVVVEKVITRIRNPAVYWLDITMLSQYRKDAHPSVYSGLHKGTTDCSHWCLPGLPDTWNHLLYAALFG